MATLAFDIYGTLVDTQGMTAALKPLAGEQTTTFAQTWRAKQLEYTFRRTLMDAYQNFDVCTAQALQYCCDVFDVDISDARQQTLLQAYLRLPAYPDALNALSQLQQRAIPTYAFSNGTQASVSSILKHNDLDDFFTAIVSADTVKQFKPHPAVYRHFEQHSATPPEACWLISANAFDITGALAAGWQAIWLQRNKAAVFDSWEYQPTAIIHSLDELLTFSDELGQGRF